jgi:hypothetical protein
LEIADKYDENSAHVTTGRSVSHTDLPVSLSSQARVLQIEEKGIHAKFYVEKLVQKFLSFVGI